MDVLGLSLLKRLASGPLGEEFLIEAGGSIPFKLGIYSSGLLQWLPLAMERAGVEITGSARE